MGQLEAAPAETGTSVVELIGIVLLAVLITVVAALLIAWLANELEARGWSRWLLLILPGISLLLIAFTKPKVRPRDRTIAEEGREGPRAEG